MAELGFLWKVALWALESEPSFPTVLGTLWEPFEQDTFGRTGMSEEVSVLDIFGCSGEVSVFDTVGEAPE